MRVADCMSSPAVTVEPDATLAEAADAMLEHRIGSVIVVDLGIVGILTRTDILQALRDNGGQLESIAVEAAMTPQPVAISPDALIDAAVERMLEHEVKTLPVLDGIDLEGVITVTDIAHQQPDRVREIRRTLDQRERWES